MDILFKTIGALGLILITIGITIKNERHQDWFFILGGLCLEAYSIYIKDPIFIILQIIFIGTASFELIRLAKKIR